VDPDGKDTARKKIFFCGNSSVTIVGYDRGNKVKEMICREETSGRKEWLICGTEDR
jgi:hypothetical protein